MELYLIRHTSVDVPQGTCYGQTDVPTRDSFEQEAALTKQNLEGLTFDKVFTSPLSRARKLAAYCGFTDAMADDRLMEMNMGDWEMQNFDDIKDENLQAWYDNYLHVRSTNGESFEDLYKRVASFLSDLEHEHYQRVAIFAHGGVLMAARVFANQITAEEALRILTPYGGIIRLDL
jgi:alpha-ribazole phosphatase